MGKKKADEMALHRSVFRQGAEKNSISTDQADAIFDLMEEFAGYGFNKSHAAAYSLLAYQTAWIKVHHTAEFFCANMTVEMGDTDKLKIGIRWKGSKHYEQDLRRSYPLSELHSNIGHLDAQFISLQRDDGTDETVDFPGIIDYNDKLETIEDAVALIDNLDIVITSCTSIAHMAASQGKEVYVFVPISTYYVWCHPTEKSPWYGNNVTILRQMTPRSWDEPMQQLKEILEKKI
jgi:hypothetical protein